MLEKGFSVGGDRHRFHRLIWLVERAKEQNNAPSPMNNAAAGYKGPSENRAFERCRSTVSMWSLKLDKVLENVNSV